MFRKILIVAILAGAVLSLLPADRADATEFAVNTHRSDPYKQFKFRVMWDGKYVPGVLFVSGLTRTTEVTTGRKGGDSNVFRRSPGQTVYEPIVLERGRTHDTAFETWANKVFHYGSGLGSEASLGDFRKDIVIQLYNEAGQVAMAFKVYNCWPSEYSALAGLDANSPEIAIERLVLHHEGWERDTAVAEPTEPTFTEP